MRDTQEPDAAQHGRAIRLAALGGVIGPILFAMLVIIAGTVYDGYSHVSQKISELGGEGAEYAIIQNVNFVMLGLFVLGFSWSLTRVLGPPNLGPALIGFFGLSSSIANGLLPCDVGCNGQTSVALLHNITGLAGFVAAIVGMLVLARRWRTEPDWRPHVGFTRAAALVSVGGLVWFVASQAMDAQAFAGVAQRTFVLALLVWIAATALRTGHEIRVSDSMASTPGAGTTITAPGNRHG